MVCCRPVHEEGKVPFVKKRKSKVITGQIEARIRLRLDEIPREKAMTSKELLTVRELENKRRAIAEFNTLKREEYAFEQALQRLRRGLALKEER
jgi:hypothetical protein